MNELEVVLEYLHNTKNWSGRNDETNSNILEALKQIKSQAVLRGDQESAKSAWCLEQILEIQTKYLTSFAQLKSENFYDGWCTLERVEIELNSLEHHFDIDNKDEYELKFIQKHIKQFQSLFPYKLFISPAFLYLEKKCTICGQLISIRQHCKHKKGEIYDGEQCLHEIIKYEVLEVSYVTNPVQKYSVLFLKNSESEEKKDHYDYSSLKYLMKGLQDPFDAWGMRRRKLRHPHSLYAHIGKDEKCPCDSGKKYEKCCLKTSGVLKPHVDFLFDVPPPESLPKISYPHSRRDNELNKRTETD